MGEQITYETEREESIDVIIEKVTNDADFLASLDIEGTDESERKYEKTVAELIEYFGSQLFSYGPYKNKTITEIISLCPPARGIVALGFDAVVEWVDQFRVDTVEEEAIDDENDPDEVNLLSDKHTLKQTPEVKVINNVEQADEQSVAKKTTVKNDLNGAKTAALKLNKEVVQRPEKPIPVQSVPGQIQAKEIIAVQRPELPGNTSLELVANTTVIGTPESVTPLELGIVEELLHAAPEIIPPVSSEVILPQTLTIEVVAPIVNTTVEPAFESVFEPQPVVIKVSKPFEAWQDLGQQAAPIELAVTEIIHDLTEYAERDIPDTLNDPTTVQEQHSEIITELPVLAAQVKRVRHHIEKLSRATTEKECRELLPDIYAELRTLLLILGYEAPDALLANFLKTHTFISIKDMIEYLEEALIQAIEYDNYATHVAIADYWRAKISKMCGSIAILLHTNYAT